MCSKKSRLRPNVFQLQICLMVFSDNRQFKAVLVEWTNVLMYLIRKHVRIGPFVKVNDSDSERFSEFNTRQHVSSYVLGVIAIYTVSLQRCSVSKTAQCWMLLSTLRRHHRHQCRVSTVCPLVEPPYSRQTRYRYQLSW